MPDRHVILTMGRTGSNTLVDILNQNPEALNYGEVLGDWSPVRKIQRRLGVWRKDEAAYLDALTTNPVVIRAALGVRDLRKRLSGAGAETKRASRLKTIGIKDFTMHFSKRGLDDYLPARPDIKVIGLTRENVLARGISGAALAATGVVSSRSANAGTAPGKVRVNAAVLVERLDFIDWETRELDRLLDMIPPERVLRLSYERCYADPEATLDTAAQVYAFLGVTPIVPKIRMSKLLSRDPLEAIENADEVREALRGTRFERWLERGGV
ncbi:sulfotransferase [Albimonas sp. CAU 1670]|uniref:sulfotransferase n=1 Tax=Albimonas sp. CAU 1670 TaxID=3032599 RepID=UPI0023DB1C9E|nr:sulfotransferase [Albimonas sp. CAU 1670]MDF2232135.1 sulfotransferase [Albimonas sp. CAU 1670]